MEAWDIARNGTSLDRARAFFDCTPQDKGGITYPWPFSLDPRCYQSPHTNARAQLAKEERERIQSETGLEVFGSIPMTEVAQ